MQYRLLLCLGMHALIVNIAGRHANVAFMCTGAMEVKDSSYHTEECVDEVTPQVVMDKKPSGLKGPNIEIKCNFFHECTKCMLDSMSLQGATSTKQQRCTHLYARPERLVERRLLRVPQTLV